MSEKHNHAFDPSAFLTSVGPGRKIVELQPEQTFFTQDDPADSIFFLKEGRAKLSVVSASGKQATIVLLGPGDFFGEDSLTEDPGLRMATAMAVNTCTALKIQKEELIRFMHLEPAFCDQFLSFLVTREIRTQTDLVDQIFNTSEKRLARTLLRMAESGKSDETQTLIPPITHETLAEMIGTTRPRVSYFMNRFRNLGLIDYKGRIQVHKPRLKAVLADQFARV
ncbi:MAG: Crp/Fnr family transcriptional regulator [Terracidiphilus sp.]